MSYRSLEMGHHTSDHGTLGLLTVIFDRSFHSPCWDDEGVSRKEHLVHAVVPPMPQVRGGHHVHCPLLQQQVQREVTLTWGHPIGSHAYLTDGVAAASHGGGTSWTRPV